MRLNEETEDRARPLTQEAGKMPQVARPEKKPQRRAMFSPEKSELGSVPGACRRGNLLARHIHPQFILTRLAFRPNRL